MKNYSELPDTKLQLDIELETLGYPDFTLSIIPGPLLNQRFSSGAFATVKQTYYLDLLTPFSIIIELQNKDYNNINETAVIVKRLSIDNISIIPEYNHITKYDNDHQFENPTNYLGFNGKWTLTIDRPFYQWLHQAQNQGWLLG